MTWEGSPAPQHQPLAGWWYRVGATVIDGILIGIPAYVIGFAAHSTYAYVLVSLIVEIVYVTVMLALLGQTVGMMAVRTRCIDGRTGTKLGFGRALGRTLIAAVLGSFSAITGLSVAVSLLWRLVDDLWPLWDNMNQTLHDKAVGSLVVRTVSVYGTTPYPPTTGAFDAPGQGWGSGSEWGQGSAPQAPPGWSDEHGWASGSSQASPAGEPAATSPVPADWYPDPAGSGNERWWDGKSWTDHVRSPS